MITKEMLRAEIDLLAEDDVPMLYQFVRALHQPSTKPPDMTPQSWRTFIAETYGSLAADPIERPDQVSFASY